MGRRTRARGHAGVEECLAYAWSLPIAVAVVGMERPALVRASDGATRPPGYFR